MVEGATTSLKGEAKQFIAALQGLLRESKVMQAKTMVRDHYAKWFEGEKVNIQGAERLPVSFVLYYMVKVEKQFLDYKFLTHYLYEVIEAHLKDIRDQIAATKDEADRIKLIEALARVCRARFVVDFWTQRYRFSSRNINVVK